MKRNQKVLIAIVCGVLVLVGAGLVYLFIPFYSYDHPPQYLPRLQITDDAVPDDYTHLYLKSYYDESGYHQDYILYAKEGSLHPLSYWQRLITGEYSPAGLRHVPYSAKEALENWTSFQTMLQDPAYADRSFRITGDLIFDEELGYRIFLILDGCDADFMKNEIAKTYGDFVVFDSETYDEAYFSSQNELLNCTYYQTPSTGYTE